MSTLTNQPRTIPTTRPNRWKFLVGGLMLLVAVGYLIFTNSQNTAQYYYTIEEMNAGAADVGENVRISGAVLGDSIAYDAETLTLSFSIAHVPGDQNEINALGGLAEVLHQAVNNPAASRLEVVYVGPLPDLMQHEAQAIMDGRVGADGVFYADTLMLKCPTRYDEQVPAQVGSSN